MPAPPYLATKEISGTGTSQTAKTPASTAIGNLLVCQVMLEGTVTPEMAGWTKLGQKQTTGPGAETHTGAWFWKIAAEAGEKNHTIAWGGTSRYTEAAITTVEKFNVAAPINTFALQANNSSSTAMKFGSVTPTVPNCLSLLCGGIDQGGLGTPPGGWTERLDNTVGGYLATKALGAAEATGEVTVTLASARYTNTAHILIAPEEPGPRPGSLPLLGVGR